MTDKKKSFLLYLDTLEILKKLTDEQAGKLLKAFLAYHSDQELDLDPMLDLVFFSFKAQFERDSIKYQNIVERNKNNGSKGGRPKNPVEPKEPSGLSGNPSKPKEPDSVSGNDKDSVSGSVKEVISHLNLVTNAKYKHTTKSHIENISARLNDGHSVDDLKKVIDSKAQEWLSSKEMAQYLRPSTLFQAGKFQGYLLSAKPLVKTNTPKEFSQ